jgi:hypothetical protein
LTKLRNRLSVDKLNMMAEVKMHIRDEHLKQKEAVQRQRRHFAARSNPPGEFLV